MQNIKSVNTIEFMGQEILIFMDNYLNPWFVGNQLLEVMEYNTYNNTSRTIQNNMDDDCWVKLKRSELDSLINDFVPIFKDGYNSEDLAMYKENIFNSIWKNNKDNKARYFINEPGMYSLVLGSKKSEAKEFRKWITTEVLPSIRRDGYYQMKENESNEVMNQLHDQINSLESKIKDKDQHISVLSKILGEKEQEVEDIKNDARKAKTDYFYSGKDHFADINPIETYSTYRLANTINPNNYRDVYKFLNSTNLEYRNYNRIVSHQMILDPKCLFLPNINMFNNGLAVWMPWTYQNASPNKYYPRWTQQGLNYIRNRYINEKRFQMYSGINFNNQNQNGFNNNQNVFNSVNTNTNNNFINPFNN